jgi:hypothetical protein
MFLELWYKATRLLHNHNEDIRYRENCTSRVLLIGFRKEPIIKLNMLTYSTKEQ